LIGTLFGFGAGFGAGFGSILGRFGKAITRIFVSKTSGFGRRWFGARWFGRLFRGRAFRGSFCALLFGFVMRCLPLLRYLSPELFVWVTPGTFGEIESDLKEVCHVRDELKDRK
jgi:hypothetical protein